MKFIRFAPVFAFAAALFAAIGLAATEKRPVNEPSAWAKDSVETAKASGLIDETDDVAYTAAVDRLTFAVVGYNALAADAPPKEAYLSYFDDTDDPRVASLASLGIIKGKGGRLFAPDDTLTREEAATILARMAKKRGLEAPERYETRYADDAAVSDWAYDAVYTVKALGLMVGKEDANFDPSGEVTYEEAVALFLRLFEAVPAPAAEGETFAEKLNKTMPTDKNYMFSPLSVKMALAMAANGAHGKTLEQILTLCGIEDIDAFDRVMARRLAEYNNPVLPVKTANGVFLNTSQTDARFLPSYLERIRAGFGAESAEVTDENAVETVNGFVNEHTNGLIPSVISDSDFAAALVNTLYFGGKWRDPFRKELTAPDTFTNRDGTTTTVDFMRSTRYQMYYADETVRMTRLNFDLTAYFDDEYEDFVTSPYNVSMYFILSDERPDNVEHLIRSFPDRAESERLILAVPRFTADFDTELSQPLAALGVTDAFVPFVADFSGMTTPTKRPLYIDRVLHKTHISVDEEGVEAAAATVIDLKAGAGMHEEEPVPFELDRPFTYVIYDETHKEVLFMGEYAYATRAETKPAFAEKLNQTMPTDKNYMFSPLSVKMALAMAAGGARRETRGQILQTIGIADLSVFNEKAKNLIETYGKLDLLKLEIANGLFLNTDHTTCTFAKDYRETMANFYGASVTEVDYDTALRTVNGWVNDKTHGKIPSILDDPHFAAALVNAIYFKGKWQDEFPQYATKEETFHNRDGSTTETPFMHRTGYYDYAVVDGTRTLAIPYQNVAETEKTDEKTGRTAFETTRVDAAVAMYVLLADERPAHPEEIVRKMGASGKRTRVSLALPKFETSYFGSLKETLQTLGMTLPFDENKADFTDMVESPYGERFYIDDVLHKTYIKTDEEGTEAAAVTAVVMARTTAIMEEPDPIPFVADRPFTYVIYDSRNDEILFMGEINTFAA